MARYQIARAAERDLQDIRDFIARDSIDAARRALDALERSFRSLAERPGIGHRREDLTKGDLRFWTVHDYLVVYDPTSNPLQVVRVLHGRRDVHQELE